MTAEKYEVDLSNPVQVQERNTTINPFFSRAGTEVTLTNNKITIIILSPSYNKCPCKLIGVNN